VTYGIPGATFRAGVDVVDISTPANPIRLGGIATTGSATSVFASPSLIFVADGAAGLQIVDFSEVSIPRLLGRLETAGALYDIEVRGPHVFFADGESPGQIPIQILDTTDMARPRLVARFGDAGYFSPIRVIDNYAYAIDLGGGLQIFDVQDIYQQTAESVTYL